jgi:hypothetical protein
METSNASTDPARRGHPAPAPNIQWPSSLPADNCETLSAPPVQFRPPGTDLLLELSHRTAPARAISSLGQLRTSSTWRARR